MANLPVPYDADFAAWQRQPRFSWEYNGVIFTTAAREGYTLDSIFTLRSGNDFWDRVIDPMMGRAMYFDKMGQPITMHQWAELRELGLDPDGSYGKSSYVRVAKDQVGDSQISTVWLGIDHGWLSATEREAMGEAYKPVIFETMIFGGKYDEYTMRYCTEWEAIKGHAEAVTDLRAGMEPWWAHGGCEDDEWHMERESGEQEDERNA